MTCRFVYAATACFALMPAAARADAQKAPVIAVADDAVVVRLGQRLRCPVCQGMSIGDSPAPMAQDMMRHVRAMRDAGDDEGAIVAYFTSRYGDWVLLDPPHRGVGFWAWALPPLALVCGVYFVLRRGARATAHAARRAPDDSTTMAHALADEISPEDDDRFDPDAAREPAPRTGA